MGEQLMIQVELHQDDRRLITWVNKTAGLLVGASITVEDHPGKWTVHEVYGRTISNKTLNSNRGFDNNNYDKHTGLF